MGRAPLVPQLKRIALLVVAGVLLAGGTQVAQVSADSNAANNKTIAQMRVEQDGASNSNGGGVATSGPAITHDHVSVPQVNVQVVAGGPKTETVSTQNATNNLIVNQGTAAISGDSNAGGGGVATSGPAVAGSIVAGVQLNIQIIACPNATGPITQTATNNATVDQLTGAVSGDATATGAGSDAHSGAAHARNIAIIRQRNVQIYRCQGNNGGGTATQTATNTTVVDQSSIAVSGNAAASGGGSATTGQAKSSSFSRVSQSNAQHASD